MSILPDLSPLIVSRSSSGVQAAELGDRRTETRPTPLAKTVIVLLGQDCGWHEHGDLKAAIDRFERSPHGDFRLAKADIAAQQPVHGLRRFHVTRHVGDGLAPGRRSR